MKVMKILQSYVYNENMLHRSPILQIPTPSPRTSIPHSLLPIPYSLFFLLFALLSCQTAPKVADVLRDQRLPLEPGAFVYIIADEDALPVLSQLMLNHINHNQLRQMVDRTRFVAAAVYLTPNQETRGLNSRSRLAAWGSYPASRVKMALGSNKEWKKRRSPVSGAHYWYSAQSGYAVAITGGMALVATAAADGQEPPDPFSAAPGTPLPEGFAAFRAGSILACWLANPGFAINQKIKEMGIPFELPAQQLFVSLFPADEQRAADSQRYTARLQIQFDSESQARGLTMMFALARNFIPPQTDTNNPNTLLLSVLFANPPDQDGKNINITTAPLSVHEIALLLKLFSI